MAENSPTSVPNLCMLVGDAVVNKLMRKVGSVAALARLSDAALRHIGMEEDGASANGHHLRAGYLAEAPVFVEFFGDECVRADDLQAARKGIAVFARKCCLALKTDISGSSPDGAFGGAELEKLRHSFELLLTEGKVSSTDTQALPVPHVFVRGEEVKKKRGGWKELRKLQAKQEAPNPLERAVSYVKMGVSEDQQLQSIIQRGDLQAQLLKSITKAVETKKRPRDGDEEYDDLMQIRL
ncbi:Putative snoRNA binding domain containing protein, putative [Trypanosoma equiperdum]|uniref:Nop domain-containing protein n=3 Tax=Trypanozoon TaxID=39700 RepID=Q57UX3_TRYB2|nr:hypothetical protein, conserved [Trypanosoma brucei brucei TREU927]AAX70591.1 hypothetical protein, conserved [Trypanosoma brucei]AAZ13243.1 hypothetical protein, conserved [Trypanosoma brucei brucei TREU927]RHW71089.1 putative snoRNA binding domain containing protein [Trypanosoma brucei equiperdum]SCU69048.1 Putative snoRNA binding domain containing protein, putative [Trypanosoma equiperdum]